MWDQKPSFRFEIDNFSDKEDVMVSQDFVAGGCEWYLSVFPKGEDYNDHLSLFLKVANHESLRTGWKRSAKYYFLVLNGSNKELYRSPIFGKGSNFFCAEAPAWGCPKTLPVSKFQEKGFLKKDKLIIEVYIKVVEAFDGDQGEDINGFQVLAAHVNSVKKIFAEREYKNTLSNACSKFSEFAEVGAKLDWLKSKFDEVSLKRKNGADESLVQELEEERIKNLELMVTGFKKDCLKSKRKMSSKMKKSHAADECRFQKLEESVKNLELMELGFKLDSFKSQLEEVSLEKKKSHEADESRLRKLEESVKNLELMDIGSKLECMDTELDNGDEWAKQLEERVKDLEVMELEFGLDCLNTKIEEVSLERKMSDDARFQQLEESVKKIELMVSCLKVELDKKKDNKSCDDEFLLVD